MRALWATALLCAALVRGAAAGNRTTQMILVKYDLQRFPYAVCNDGTAGACGARLRAAAARSGPLSGARFPRCPGGFYLAPATNPNRTKIWVILLEGGQWCWDAQSCGIRSQQNPALTTSSIWPPHMEQTGIFNADPRRKCVRPRRRARPGAAAGARAACGAPPLTRAAPAAPQRFRWCQFGLCRLLQL